MKKLISTILTLALIFAVNTTAFASEANKALPAAESVETTEVFFGNTDAIRIGSSEETRSTSLPTSYWSLAQKSYTADLQVVGKHWLYTNYYYHPNPFRTIYGSVYIIVHRTNPYLIPHEIISLLGNFALFMPFGYFVPRLFEKYRVFIRFILFTFVVLLSIETIQVLTIRGCFDVDDIILNLAGAVIGFFIARIAMSWKRSDAAS